MRGFTVIKSWLAHPLTRGLDIDSPETTHLRTRILQNKPFLRRIYQEWYKGIASAVPQGAGEVLELGSGGGFLKRYIPDLVTSDVFPIPKVSLVVDAHYLPFTSQALRAVVMTNVLHHLSNVQQFFREAARCVRPGGVVAMIEPWVTPWSRLIYTWLHHEPFQPNAPAWELPPAGPLSGANGALPWILFERDQQAFTEAFPEWDITEVTPLMPFRYLVSGGVSLRNLMPGFTYHFWRGLEEVLRPWMSTWAMFAKIVLVRQG
jgi:SAM-dependent methyltransferase